MRLFGSQLDMHGAQLIHSSHASLLPVQPEAIRAAVEAVASEPLEHLGEALQGFTWEFESKVCVWGGGCGVWLGGWVGLGGAG